MTVLGKRKAPSKESPGISEQEAAEIFRRHFEAQFKPLEDAESNKTKKRQAVVGNIDDARSEESSEESEWGGLPDDEQGLGREESDGEEEDDEDGVEDHVVEVVDHSSSQAPKPAAMSKREFRAFMSSKPPDQSATKPQQSQPDPATSSTLPEDAPSLIAQDLELRRLLAESHLLSPSSLSSSTLEPKPFSEGRTRHKATDLRIQALGSKSSILKQEKMPMGMRKGMAAAAEGREAKRRREAKENGIILERPGVSKSKGAVRRKGPGAVDRPGVGRMKGAELRINDHDVKRIEGARDTFGRRGRR